MGGSSSKETKPEVDNKGVLNGNVINEAIESDLSNAALLLKIVIVLKSIHILIKWLIKFIKNQSNKEQKIEQILLEQNTRQ